ncbi:MAG: alpha/beta fold hydrolase, partial [Gammaproteobacteria bacterium]|nr:alpha/beta fold hydrolase [Gammaproteobacteria bacterium]
NITFYPIHTDENFLHRAVGMFRDDISPSLDEELLIEANLLLKNTDMDIRLARPVCLSECRPWWERKLLSYVAANLNLIEDFFTFQAIRKPFIEKLTRVCIKRSSEKIRDQYMESIYHSVSVNLSHLASTLLLDLINNNRNEIDYAEFCRLLYLSVKRVQKLQDIHLHRSLRNPEVYSGLIYGNDEAISDLVELGIKNNLLARKGSLLHLYDELSREYEFDTIRMENILQVYANEIAPLGSVLLAIRQAIQESGVLNTHDLAALKHDDELRRYDWNHHYYSKARFNEINRTESIMESGRPFFYLPEFPQSDRQAMGILLVHGFLASPAEMKPVAEKLLAEGYPVYGVRLAGHGTSPADLRERSWQDWLASVQRGYEILASRVDTICMLGFSTGGALSLLHAADQPEDLQGVIVINPPMKFRNRKMKFVPILHGVSRIVRWSSSLEGVIPYRRNEPEHPRINYRNVPVRGLYELMQLKNRLRQRLDQVRCACLIIQSSDDPITTPDSADILAKGLVNASVSKIRIDSDRHGILYEDTDNLHERISGYIRALGTPECMPEQFENGERQWAG